MEEREVAGCRLKKEVPPPGSDEEAAASGSVAHLGPCHLDVNSYREWAQDFFPKESAEFERKAPQGLFTEQSAAASVWSAILNEEARRTQGSSEKNLQQGVKQEVAASWPTPKVPPPGSDEESAASGSVAQFGAFHVYVNASREWVQDFFPKESAESERKPPQGLFTEQGAAASVWSASLHEEARRTQGSSEKNLQQGVKQKVAASWSAPKVPPPGSDEGAAASGSVAHFGACHVDVNACGESVHDFCPKESAESERKAPQGLFAEQGAAASVWSASLNEGARRTQGSSEKKLQQGVKQEVVASWLAPKVPPPGPDEGASASGSVAHLAADHLDVNAFREWVKDFFRKKTAESKKKPPQGRCTEHSAAASVRTASLNAKARRTQGTSGKKLHHEEKLEVGPSRPSPKVPPPRSHRASAASSSVPCLDACELGVDAFRDRVTELLRRKREVPTQKTPRKPCKKQVEPDGAAGVDRAEKEERPKRGQRNKRAPFKRLGSTGLEPYRFEDADKEPYQCHRCDAKLKYKRDLEYHVSLHTGAPLLPCEFCPMVFPTGRLLSRHCTTHHGRLSPLLL